MLEKKILDVPKIKQLEKCYCGPAALSMVFAYYGLDLHQEKIADEIFSYNPFRYFYFPIDKNGMAHSDMIRCARDHGFIAHQYQNSSLEKLVELIENDIPPIARVHDTSTKKVAHVCVIKGYDLEKKIVYLNDPGKVKRVRLSFNTFKELWIVESKNWGNSRNDLISIRPKQ